MQELIKKIEAWGDEKGITFSANRKSQALKVVEEVGEVCRGVLKDDLPQVTDGIGDVIVTLILLAKQYNLSIEQCLQVAWDEIKDRKGKMVDGSFIKDSK